MVRRCTGTAIASRCRCMRRCTRFLASLACPRRSRSKFKGLSGEFHGGHSAHRQNIEQKGQKGAQVPNGAFQGADGLQVQTHYTPTVRWPKGKSKRSLRGSGAGGSGSSSGSESSASENPHFITSESCGSCSGKEVERRWDARRRDSRVNGADIYVARFTKNGMGSARPCWRCLEWCKWAGVKRIFHWNNEEGRFDVVKVNSAQRDIYETHADFRLFAGLGW
ncbi:hypothetical protein SCP_1001910 [Sparassis crispa]|uniref:CMP/dCMP-type deaminase domain-containing protein n=1 Tax=Sparassis crispa TaxID=139825 RepID=A0A401GXK5_9APHY|nr:hypothetical protein SCP_1001910 [Sparassis crispa]GBE86947.1 hypothetical protein SCP_1001910 [Sparassis crispa]